MPISRIKFFFHAPAKQIVFFWIFAFLTLNLVVPQGGGDNAVSRLAAIQSFISEGDYKINRFIGRTCDWSRTSLEKYYSNKAPGGMYLGAAVLGITEKALALIGRYDLSKQNQEIPGTALRTFLCLLTQMIPLCVAAFLFANLLLKKRSSNSTLVFLCLAVFLGNTASIYMNTYFGHGLIATYTLLGLYFFLTQRIGLTAFFWSLALLSDYAFLAQIPAALLLFFFALKHESKSSLAKNLALILLGSAVPLLLWVNYHNICFGSAFTLPQRFINPAFLDIKNASAQGMGLFDLPNPMIPLALLFGMSRGILFTQPWVLACIAFSLLHWKTWTNRSANPILFYTTVFCLISFLGLLGMNASFYGWHGGMAAGPRYMSSIFPCFAILVCLQYSFYSEKWKKLLWALLGYSLVIRGFIYGTTILAPTELSLFRFFFEHLKNGNLVNNGLRLFLYFSLTIAGILFSRRKASGKVRLTDFHTF